MLKERLLCAFLLNELVLVPLICIWSDVYPPPPKLDCVGLIFSCPGEMKEFCLLLLLFVVAACTDHLFILVKGI